MEIVLLQRAEVHWLLQRCHCESKHRHRIHVNRRRGDVSWVEHTHTPPPPTHIPPPVLLAPSRQIKLFSTWFRIFADRSLLLTCRTVWNIFPRNYDPVLYSTTQQHSVSISISSCNNYRIVFFFKDKSHKNVFPVWGEGSTDFCV